MLRAINQHCFQGKVSSVNTRIRTYFYLLALLDLAPAQFKLVIDSIVWGFKHTMRDIADTGLLICGELVDNVSRTDPSISGGFYQNYYLSILQDIFFVLTDRDHKSGKGKEAG
jgi:exportin-1